MVDVAEHDAVLDDLGAVVRRVIDVQRQIIAAMPDGQARRLLEEQIAGLHGHVVGDALRRLNVGEVSVTEPSGTVRLVVTSAALEPRGRPGLLFFNDEGVECGGLTFRGGRFGDTYGQSSGLMFDRYQQDQVIGIMHQESGQTRETGFHVWDQPEMPLTEALERYGEEYAAIRALPDGPEKGRAFDQLREKGAAFATRIFCGKTHDGKAALILHDPRGRPRIRLSVDDRGGATIEVLDETGAVVHDLVGGPPPTSTGAPPT